MCTISLTSVPFLSGDEKDSLITFAGFGKKTGSAGSGATAAVSATCLAGLLAVNTFYIVMFVRLIVNSDLKESSSIINVGLCARNVACMICC